jgi:hypothetical protein
VKDLEAAEREFERSGQEEKVGRVREVLGRLQDRIAVLEEQVPEEDGATEKTEEEPVEVEGERDNQDEFGLSQVAEAAGAGEAPDRRYVMRHELTPSFSLEEMTPGRFAQQLQSDLEMAIAGANTDVSAPVAAAVRASLTNTPRIRGADGQALSTLIRAAGEQTRGAGRGSLSGFLSDVSEAMAGTGAEDLLRFRTVAGGTGAEWGSAVVDVYVDRGTGTYVMNANVTFVENAAGKSAGTTFAEYGGEVLSDTEAGAYAFTVAGEIRE